VRIPQIQALRALASILVVIYHAELVPGGYIGVDIFYVISGYLITGLIVREIENSRGFDFKAFYLRRIKRLLPTSFFILMVTALISWWLFPVTMREDLAKDIFAASVYVSNFLFAAWQMDYQNLEALPPVVIHYWSLAVEEQFYIFWPFIIFALFKHGSKKRLGLGIGAITAASFIFSLYLTSVKPIWAFYSLPTRAWELGVGALLIFIPTRIRFSSVYLWIASTLIIYSTFFYDDSTPFPGTAALAPVIATAFAIAAVKSWPSFLDRPAQSRISQWLGEISYPLYLWHWPILVIPSIYLGRGLRFYQIAVCILATLVAAHLTHIYVEEPLRHRKFAPQTLVKYLAYATSFSVLLSLSIFLSSSDITTLPDGTKFSITEITSRPKIYQDGCHANNGETVSDACEYGDLNSNQTIILFGDSHAAQWFPAIEAIAIARNLKLVSLTKSACPGPAVKKVDTGEYKNSDCSSWRKNSIQRIQEIRPIAVLVAGMQNFKLPSEYSSRTQWWQEGLQKTLDGLSGSSPHLINLRDTPHPKRDIPSCIATGRLERCNTSEKTEIITIPGFEFIDSTPWLCGRTCPAIVNGVVAYRDASHLSVAMAEKLTSNMDQALSRLRVFQGS
jgi:peptidoglycan/LPS O-acetylase OafA/YrhL